MKLAITLLFVLFLATAAVAGEAELSDIQRPVDAQATTDEEAAFVLGEVEEAEAEGPYRMEGI